MAAEMRCRTVNVPAIAGIAAVSSRQAMNWL